MTKKIVRFAHYSRPWGQRVTSAATDTELVLLALLDIPFQSAAYYQQCEMLCRTLDRFPTEVENWSLEKIRLRCAEKVIQNHLMDLVLRYRPDQTHYFVSERTHRDGFVLSSLEHWLLDRWMASSKQEKRLPIREMPRLLFRKRSAPLQAYVDSKTHQKNCFFNT